MSALLPPNTFYVVSYPRSGNTWLVNCLVLLLDGVRGEDTPYQLNTEAHGTPEQGFQFWCEPRVRPDQPICLKSHDDLFRFRERHPPAPIIYIARDARDSLLSYYFFLQAYPTLSVEELSTTNINGTQVLLSRGGRDPVFNAEDFASFLSQEAPKWAAHVNSAARVKEVCYLTYEDLIRDFAPTLQRAIQQSNLQPVRTYAETEAVYHKGFGAVFAGNNRDFFRRGQIGDWKNWYDTRHARLVDELIGRHLFDLGFEADRDWVAKFIPRDNTARP
ncbi:MAG: sulfotransferase domain-containing protein [Opitutales bacterium]